MKVKTKTIVLILIAVLVSGGLMQIGSVLAETGWFGSSSATKPTYEEWITSLDVHDKFKADLESLSAAHDRGDLMVAYTFLYYQYGTFDQLVPLVKAHEDGSSWEDVFLSYHSKHEAFVPRTYDSAYLESLTSAATVSSDDIMIADRISYVSGKPINELLPSKLENGQTWKEISADLNIVNGSSELPRVEITADQLEQFATNDFPDEKVAEAFVLAQKVDKEPKDVVDMMESGRSEAYIMAKSWSELFSS